MGRISKKLLRYRQNVNRIAERRKQGLLHSRSKANVSSSYSCDQKRKINLTQSEDTLLTDYSKTIEEPVRNSSISYGETIINYEDRHICNIFWLQNEFKRLFDHISQCPGPCCSRLKLKKISQYGLLVVQHYYCEGCGGTFTIYSDENSGKEEFNAEPAWASNSTAIDVSHIQPEIASPDAIKGMQINTRLVWATMVTGIVYSGLQCLLRCMGMSPPSATTYKKLEKDIWEVEERKHSIYSMPNDQNNEDIALHHTPKVEIFIEEQLVKTEVKTETFEEFLDDEECHGIVGNEDEFGDIKLEESDLSHKPAYSRENNWSSDSIEKGDLAVKSENLDDSDKYSVPADLVTDKGGTIFSHMPPPYKANTDLSLKGAPLCHKNSKPLCDHCPNLNLPHLWPTEEKPCEHCSHKSTESTNLWKPMLIPTEEKPFSCEIPHS